jgi:NurA domain
MSVDFQQLQRQVNAIGENALARENDRKKARTRARELLTEYSQNMAHLRDKVFRAAKADPGLRCALPKNERMDGTFDPPESPKDALIIAADGSQINPDRHAEINFSLINVGSIQMTLGASAAPTEFIRSELLADDQLFSSQGSLTEGMIALKRDMAERTVLYELASMQSKGMLITFTDGPLELWGVSDQVSNTEFQKSFKKYLQILEKLRDLGVISAGYVDRPGANYVVRLLEIGMTPENRLSKVRVESPLRDASDRGMFEKILPSGCRSAIFGLHAPTGNLYADDQKLNFFYLNVGLEDKASLARVEIPEWVARESRLLDSLHAVLVEQCRILGSRTYPYLLHRAHEAAVVTQDEKDQITQMIIQELRRRGIPVEELSQKQFLKTLARRSRYQ